ncbi:hypothetical protein GJ496_006023 [Pomphorhynchus laevis]|nr:hypothetical protein GJ496_006023 [Pomphorhynchus laevis]
MTHLPLLQFDTAVQRRFLLSHFHNYIIPCIYLDICYTVINSIHALAVIDFGQVNDHLLLSKLNSTFP